MEKAITRFPAYSDCVSIVVGGIHEFFYCVVGTARIYIHGDNERVRALVIRFDGGGGEHCDRGRVASRVILRMRSMEQERVFERSRSEVRFDEFILAHP